MRLCCRVSGPVADLVLICRWLVLPPTLTHSRRMSQFTNWCFTDFTDGDEPDVDPSQVRYIIAQQERCPDTGRIHWQGYIQLSRNQRFTFVKKLNPWAHWEPAKGTPLENKAYCTKDETRVSGTDPYEFGEMKKQGQRKDIEDFKDAIKQGKRKRDLIEEYSGILSRYPRFYDTVAMTMCPKINTDRKVILLYGKPGAGKTRFVYDAHGDSMDFWRKPIGNGSFWFDHYDGHKFVLIDEFEGAASKVPLDVVLQLLDIYPLMVPTKGSHVWWNPEIIYICSNSRPDAWYDFTG